MALNSTGPISLGGATTGQSINLELRVAATTQISLNDATVRFLLGASSGAISLSNAYGKTNGTPVVITSNFKSVASNGTNILVAVGDGAAIVRSSDGGSTWIVTSPPSGVTANLVRVKYFNGYFIAVGPATMIYSTDNGVTWTKNTSVTAGIINAVSYDSVAGRYIVAGYSTSTGTGGVSTVIFCTTVEGTWATLFNASSAGLTAYVGANLAIGGIINDYAYNATYGRHILITSTGQHCQNAQQGAGGYWSLCNTSGVGNVGTVANCTRMAFSLTRLSGIAVGTQIRLVTITYSQSGVYNGVTYSSPTLYGVKELDATNFVGVGTNGALYTVDSTVTVPQYFTINNYSISGFTQTLYEIDGNSTYGYVAVGTNGTLIRSTNYLSGTWTAAATYTIP